MIMKYRNHKPQTNPWHHKEEPHISMSLEPRAKFTFTCCDKVSAFHGKNMKAAWRVWNALEKATEVFQKLGNMPETTSDDAGLV